MIRFTYPARLEKDEEGGFVVTFQDLPEAITQGDTLKAALDEAVDCLTEAIARRIDDEEDIPVSSQAKPGEHEVAVPLQMALKAAVYLALRESGVSKSELARRLGVDEKMARRIIDPRHRTRLPLLERALEVLGRHAELVMA